MKNILSIIVIVISLAAFVLVVKPGYTEIKDLETKNSDLEHVLDNARKLQSIRDDLLEKRKNLSRSDVTRLEKLIPESADNVKLIIEFQNIAQRYGLEIQTASAQKDDELGQLSGQNFDIDSRDYGIITLNFTISGGYAEFVSFLGDVEDNLRIIDLKDLSISGGEEGEYDFTMTVETYWLKDNI